MFQKAELGALCGVWGPNSGLAIALWGQGVTQSVLLWGSWGPWRDDEGLIWGLQEWDPRCLGRILLAVMVRQA